MTKSNDRVLIAQDVLQWLRGGKIIAKHMTYMTWNGEYPTIILDKELSVQLRDAPICNVCAKGAAFIVALDRFNEIKAREVLGIDNVARETMSIGSISGEEMENFLLRFWDKEQIDQIEAAFEGWSKESQVDNQGVYGDELYDFSRARMDERHADIRLAMIMRNVIAHDGDFDADDFLEEMFTGYDHSILDPEVTTFRGFIQVDGRRRPKEPKE